ncbi:hypothetical protein BGX38DRAFT_1182084, partial [Terfezia claveryi]
MQTVIMTLEFYKLLNIDFNFNFGLHLSLLSRNIRPQLPVPRTPPSETAMSDASDTLTIEEFDLLIRSASTFLSIVQQQIEPPFRRSEHHPHYEVLMASDRVATLLTCREKSDVTAVLVVQGRDSTTIFTTVSENAVIPIQGLYSMKNSTRTAAAKSSYIPVPKVSTLRQIRGSAITGKRCFSKG